MTTYNIYLPEPLKMTDHELTEMVMVAEGVNKTMLTHLYMTTLKRSLEI